MASSRSVTWSGPRSVSRSPSQRPTTRRASCHDPVALSTRGRRLDPGQRPELGDQPAAERMVGRHLRLSAATTDPPRPDSDRRSGQSAGSRRRMRVASPDAALRVKVRPRICSGRTSPFATRNSTRAAIVSVLPDPAPATTSAGASGASMTAACSSVGRGQLQSLRELGGGDHLVTCRPSFCSGQLLRTGHRSHRAFSVAHAVAEARWAAADRIEPSHSAVSDGESRSCWSTLGLPLRRYTSSAPPGFGPGDPAGAGRHPGCRHPSDRRGRHRSGRSRAHR